jgi:ParB family chromosome partitioning protein
MANNKGLGKGLGALISLFDEDLTVAPAKQNTPAISADKTEIGVTEVDITKIDNNKNQPRREFDPQAMYELEQSILANGVIQPIVLNQVGSRFMIVAGERRWRAAKSVGLKTIPAVVREYTPKQVAEIALVENLLRADLNEYEIACGIKKLMSNHNMTQEQTARVLGKSRSAVANYIRILDLQPEILQMLEKNQITAGHAKCLLGEHNLPRRIDLAKKCVNGLAVRDLENLISKPSSSSNRRYDAPEQSLELRNFTRALEIKCGGRVMINGNDARGKIIIEYDSTDDLERLMRILK